MINQSTVTIPNGTATSAAVDLGQLGSRRNLVLGLVAPAALTNTIHVNVSTDNVTYGRFQSPPGTDIAIPAGKAMLFTDFPFRYLKLVTAAGNEGADRVFQITGSAKP